MGWTITSLVLLAAGAAARALGGRPMLFALLFCWGLAVCAALMGLSHKLSARAGRWLRRGIAAALCAGVLAFGTLEAIVLAGAHTDLKGEPQAMVVLGANLWGEEPSPVLKARLNAALEYLADHEDTVVVVSGGQADDEVMSEAAAMGRYLEENGVSKSRILLEEQARNTLQNLAYSRDLLMEQGYSTEHLIVVSNGAHLSRARMLGRRCGMEVSCIAAPTPGGVMYNTYFHCREAAALLKSWLLDRRVPYA